jgi:hypothetical protein
MSAELSLLFSASVVGSNYPLKYSNFILDDKLFNLMCEMNNAVPHWVFELNSATAVAETGDLKGQILRFVRMW